MTGCGSLNESSENVGGRVFTLGCGSLRSLTLREMAALQREDQILVTEFRSFVYRNVLVTTSDHSVVCERDNSVIETSSGFAEVASVVVAEELCSCEGESSCSCRGLVVFCKKLLRTNGQPTIQNTQIGRNVADFLVRVKRSDELCTVACGDIVAKCFMVEQKGQLYVMRLPVFETHCGI